MSERSKECYCLREIYEVWAGSEGYTPETPLEVYLDRLIRQMRDLAADGLND